MRILLDAQAKLRSTIEVIEELEGMDFPHPDARIALKKVKAVVKKRLEELEELDSDTDASVVKAYCVQATSDIAHVLNLTGFVVNSANVRNAFELHQPILSISKSLIGDDAQLLLSFEWDYVPFTWPQNFPYLPEFVVIGLPASEANNPLIVPAIGHELGHSVWQNSNIRGELNTALQDAILSTIRDKYWKPFHSLTQNVIHKKEDLEDLAGKQLWENSYLWGLSQAEELFCDSVGLFLFGTSYLHTFSYLLAPTIGDRRSVSYPNIKDRAGFLESCAARAGVDPITDFTKRFDNQASPFAPAQYSHLLLQISDSAVESLHGRIFELANKVCSEKGLKVPRETDWQQIVSAFKVHVPATGVRNIAEIVNAGWAIHRDRELMNAVFGHGRRAVSSLNELMLKSIEVLEVEGLLRESQDDPETESNSGGSQGGE